MKIIVLIPFFAFFPLQSIAQDKENNEIETLKIAFITDMLELTPAEAQEFWPVYNKYEKIEDSYRTNLHCDVYDKMDELKTMSDQKSKQMLQQYMELQQQVHELRENYVAALKKIISSRQIMLLKKAEYDFHRKLLKEYRSKNKD